MNKLNQATFKMILSFVFALWLTLLPLPTSFVWLAPAYLPLMLIYWVLHLPDQFGYGRAFLLGLTLDITSSSLLGEHAFAFLLLTATVVIFHQPLRKMSSLQQAVMIIPIIFMYQITRLMIQILIGQVNGVGWLWLSALTSALLWAMICFSLDDVDKKMEFDRR